MTEEFNRRMVADRVFLYSLSVKGTSGSDHSAARAVLASRMWPSEQRYLGPLEQAQLCEAEMVASRDQPSELRRRVRHQIVMGI